MKHLLWVLRVASLLTLAPIVVAGSLWSELKGGILNCPFPLPFIMCNACPIFCHFGLIRTELFYGILGGNFLLGRVFCGFFCPGGAAQDSLFKLPLKKFTPPPILDEGLKYLKYFLSFFIVLLVLEATQIWRGIPFISGLWSTLIGYAPLVGNALIALIAFSLLLSIFLRRPFCRYLCPLGAWISPFNKYSLINLDYDQNKCLHCHQCFQECSGKTKPTSGGWDSTECLRCLNCYTGCKNRCFSFKLKGG